MTHRYLRVIPETSTPEQHAVFDAGHNALIYHMTWTKEARSVGTIHADANGYVADFPADFPAGFRFTLDEVEAALEALANVGLEARS